MFRPEKQKRVFELPPELICRKRKKKAATSDDYGFNLYHWAAPYEKLSANNEAAQFDADRYILNFPVFLAYS